MSKKNSSKNKNAINNKEVTEEELDNNNNTFSLFNLQILKKWKKICKN